MADESRPRPWRRRARGPHPLRRVRKRLRATFTPGILIGGARGTLPRRYLLVMLVPAILLVAGTLGYWLLEDCSAFDAFYMTVITLTTVGYGEVPSPLSARGRLFTIFLLLGGVFTLFWAAGEMIRAIVSGEMHGILGRLRMERSLAELEDHLIVCGFGRMGSLVCREFSQQGLPFVVIDNDEELLRDFDLPHGIALLGDASSDEMLRKAGVERARALVTVAGSDADNLYITMSARLLNEKLFIVARAEEDHAEQKLLRAGANRVVSPYVIGGSRVAQAVLRPTVVDFIELATRTEHFELQIEETLIAAGSKLVGQTLRDSLLHKKYGIFIVAIKKASGQMVYNPPGDTVLEVGDTLIALGHREQLDELDRQAAG
jgi:voltage-gated potassium channel